MYIKGVMIKLIKGDTGMSEALSENVKAKADFHSQKRFDMLNKRTKRCVCKYCGGRLKLRRIIFSEFEDARVEMFCRDCNRIEFGVEKEIYQSAKFFVENSKFNLYPDLDESAQTKQMTVSKICEIMVWENQNLGWLDADGYTVPLNINENFLGECITLTDEDLLEDEEIETIYAKGI